MGKPSNNVAWGLEFGGSAVRLVCVTRSNSGYHADKFLETPLDERWEKAADAPAAVEQMGAKKVNDPLVACVSDELILFRTLSLPQAQTTVLEKMVQGQLEVLIPTQVERFATGYNSYADPYNPGRQRVLLCAARRDTLTGILQGCKRLGREPDGIVPSVLSLAAMWARLGEETQTPLAILDVGARCTSIAFLEGGQVVQCGVVDSASDHWTEKIAEKLGVGYRQAEQRKLQYSANPSAVEADQAVQECLQQALNDWSGQLREVYEHCLQEIPQDRRPKRCIAFGRSVHAPGVSVLIASTLGLEVVKGTAPKRLSLAEGMDFSCSAAAIGAALYAMESDWPAVSLAARPKDKRRIGQKVSRWRWAALVGWLLGAMLVLYGLDKLEANKLNNTLRDTRAKIEQQGGLARQLAISHYLETDGPTPLAALDRISEVLPEKTLLTSWHYNHNGDVTIRGTVPNENEFRKMYEKLCEVAKVDLKSGQPDKDKFRFEFRLVVGRSAKPSASEPSAEGKSEPTAPATSETDAKKTTEPSEKPATKHSTTPTAEAGSKTSETATNPKSPTDKPESAEVKPGENK